MGKSTRLRVAVHEHLEAVFPNLRTTPYRVVSDQDACYNGIAWAAGDDKTPWWPDPGHTAYWPADVPREEGLSVFMQAYVTLGYEPCENGNLESGFEKIALYALGDEPMHAARQLADGTWTSKLGDWEDIEHSLDGLAGDIYGNVMQFMRRRRQSAAGAVQGE